MTKRDEFDTRFNSYKTEEAQLRKQTDSLGNLRLVVFLAGVAVTIALFVKALVLPSMIAAAAALIAFACLIKRHRKLLHGVERLGALADINRMYRDRLQTEWVDFSDCGQEFYSTEHPYTADLDIFGPKSLFQWISTANTYYGRKSVAELLEKPDKRIEAIGIRQKAVREMNGKLDFCQRLQCEGILAKGAASDPHNLLTYAEDSSRRFKSDWIQNLFYILPASVILAFVLFFLGAPIPLFVPLLLLAFQMSVCAVGYSKNSAVTNSIYGLKRYLDAFGNILQLLENENFENETLKELKSQLFHEKQPASAALKNLERISNAIDVKFSTVAHFILNFGLLWDYHCVFALEEWKRRYGGQIKVWLETVGQMEAYSSLAVIGQIHPEWGFPRLHSEGLAFSALQMGHPLIPYNSVVCNDFEIERGACVITGSNMSGKTTLLRTIGINLVLAYAGAPVFARKLECPVLDVFTSMRIRDDLSGGISTFYAELLRIKEIINYSYKKQPMIYLIDEIFKGTNSLDRIAGARSVLKNLSKSWIIGLISTHDFELCDLEHESAAKIRNYHFTEQYTGNEIRFDYKIHEGRCTTTNAKYLMKMVGINISE